MGCLRDVVELKFIDIWRNSDDSCNQAALDQSYVSVYAVYKHTGSSRGAGAFLRTF